MLNFYQVYLMKENKYGKILSLESNSTHWKQGYSIKTIVVIDFKLFTI